MKTIKFQKTGPEYTVVSNHKKEFLGAVYRTADRQHIFRAVSKNTSFDASELSAIAEYIQDLNSAQKFERLEHLDIRIKESGVKYGFPYYNIYQNEVHAGSIFFDHTRFKFIYNLDVIKDENSRSGIRDFVESLNSEL